MNLLRTFLFLLLSSPVLAADPLYPVSAIPAHLLKGADVVKRAEQYRYEIINAGEAVFNRRTVYTILNEEGERHAPLVVHYNKMLKVASIEGALYAADGSLLRRLKPKEIQDHSAVDDISLVDDNRVKVHDFNHRSYPYTVVYETEIVFRNTYSIPRWYPQPSSGIAVEESYYSFIAPQSYEVRYKAFQYKGEPVVSTVKEKKTYGWKVAQLVAVSRPFASPLWHELAPAVHFAPSKFRIQDYEGHAGSWEELGRFQLLLNEGRDLLPEAMVQKVAELTRGISSESEKVRVLYEYMQQHTRYISIQLGIGGLQPFEASFVAKNGYGDCKALSNYMQSLLKAAGINAYYCWINAGRDVDDRYLSEDFPSDQFNHIVLCVPMARDTMWLECTSQTDPAGYLGGFTGNRKALMIGAGGGKLVSTPRYGVAENLQQRQVKAKLAGDGTLSMQVHTLYRGVQQDRLSGMVSSYTADELRKSLQKSYDLGTYDIGQYNYQWKKGRLPELNEQLEVMAYNYATASGKRLFIVPNVLNRGGYKIVEDTARKVDLVFTAQYRDVDSIIMEIPEGYEVESAPKNISLQTPFGSYSVSTNLEGNKILYRRTCEQYAGRFPASEQKKAIAFYEEIYRSDRARFVLVRKS